MRSGRAPGAGTAGADDPSPFLLAPLRAARFLLPFTREVFPGGSIPLPPGFLFKARGMSLRDQILEQLTEHPDGLTSKELALKCASAEGDAQMVGRVIAGLRAENVIHPGSALRDGGAVWIFGKSTEREAPIERITLPDVHRAMPGHVSEAARAIAAMRQSKSTAQPAPARASTPATTPAPAAAVVHQEPAMKTIRERIEAALKEHGPMDSRTMRKRGLKHDALAQHLADLLNRKILVHLGGGPRSRIYGLPGQKAGEAAPPPSAEPRAPKPPKALKAKKAAKKARVPRAPAAPKRVDPPAKVNGGPYFAINETGELGIELEGQKLRLDSAAFARLRSFIDLTKPVWQGGE